MTVETFPTCRAALAALVAREVAARESQTSLAHLCAELDPETASVRIMTRDAFRARCRTPHERGLVAYVDPPDVMRIVMVDGKGDGRSVTVAEFAQVLDLLEAENGQ